MILKKHYYVLTLLSFFAFSSFAQEDFNGSINWGEPFKVSKRELGPTPIGVAGDHFYATSRIKKTEYMNSFDLNSLSFERKNKLELVDGRNKLTKKQNFVFGDEVLYLTSYVDKAAKKERFQLHSITGSLSLGEGRELVSLDWEKTSKVVLTKKALNKKLARTNSFSAVASEDQKYLLVSYSESLLAKESTTILFDEDLEEVARETLTLPFEKFRTTSAVFGNDGKYYILGYTFEIEEGQGLIKRSTSVDHEYSVLIYDPRTGEIEDFQVGVDKSIYSSRIKLMDDGSIYLYGMYTNEGVSGVTGAFFEKYNKSYELEFSETNTFEEDFITQHWTARQKKKAENKKKRAPKKAKAPSLYSYIMHDLAVKDNGDVVLIAEQYYMYVTTTTHRGANGSSYTTTTYHYIYNDVVTVNCTSEGEITWKNLIKKRQHSTNDGGYYSSFYTAVDGNEVIFVFNDKEANLDDAAEATTRRDKKKAKRKTVAAFIRLNDEGEFDRRTLFDFEGDESRTLVPKLCRKMNDKEFLLYTNASRRGKILGLVTME